MNKEQIREIENKIDSYLFDILDENIPRNKFVYHCNLAFIDILIDQKLQFTPVEKEYVFALDYLTFVAHKKLKEEDKFEFDFDNTTYAYAFEMLQKGMEYSLLCNIFPLLHSEKATMSMTGNGVFKFNFKEMPRKNYRFINEYTIKKALNYTLQIANGKLLESCDDEISLKLCMLYFNFWNENMMFTDYEPYTQMDWGGISFFLVNASMRRFNLLYKNDFDIIKTDSQKMMIIFSPQRAHELRNFVPTNDEKLYKLALEDNIYKPLGNNLFPKSSVADAPLNKTKDGYIFANPLVLLFSHSSETRHLNYLRKFDKPRYLRVKDKIKERVIPLIEEMVNYKFPRAKVVKNFNVKIPGERKAKRECDLLIIDEIGNAIYIEIKHYYYPISFSETKILDSELSLALDKIPKQLNAITQNWDVLKGTYGFDVNLQSIKGIIASHHYTGLDVKIDDMTPIVKFTNVYESIAEAQNINEIFEKCKENDLIYPNVKLIKRAVEINYAGYKFNTFLECLDPIVERKFIESYRKIVEKSINFKEKSMFSNTKELAKAYIDKLS